MTTWQSIGIGLSIGIIIVSILEAQFKRWGK